VSTVNVEQPRLALRMGGLRLQCITARKGVACKVTFIVAAVLSQDAFIPGSESLQLFNGASGVQLEQT
jgi:hypothetical protein